MIGPRLRDARLARHLSLASLEGLVDRAGIAHRVARFKPVAVVKG